MVVMESECGVMRICLVDDDRSQLEYLYALLQNWSLKTNIEVLVSLYQSAEEMLFECGNSFPFDLVILDIQMDKMNGIQLSKRIREADNHVMIIFLSGIADYVYEGYEVQAYRYLLKPLKEEKLFEILEYMEKITEKKEKYILYNKYGETEKIMYDQIMYLESQGNSVVIHTMDKEYVYRKNLHMIEDDFLNNGFIKTHRSFIVNLLHIRKIQKENCVLASGDNLPISRRTYKQVNQAFIKFYRGEEK